MAESKRTLFLIWHSEPVPTNKFLMVENHVFSNIIDRSKYSEEQYRQIQKQLRNFISQLVQKWKESHRVLAVFEKRNKMWLDEDIIFPNPAVAQRNEKPFSECTRKTQIKKIASIANETPNEELMVATSVSLYKAGKRSASQVVSKLCSESTIAPKMLKSVDSEPKTPIPYTPEEALALYTDGGYSKRSYRLMQYGAKERNCNIYPSYDILAKTKTECYPSAIHVTERSAEVGLQTLVDHTIARIIQGFSTAFEDLMTVGNNNDCIKAIFKWGCDGSSGHSTYRQRFSVSDTGTIDEHLFAVCIVPLQIKKGPAILWQNNRPSSTRFCRPIKIIFEKESADLVRAEIENVKRQIAQIVPTKLSSFEVTHEFHLTMIDGKVFNTIAESSSLACGICGATPKLMNNLNLVQLRQPQNHLYEYGLSTLHAWIRCFECIIHIAYRIPIKNWQIRGENKEIAEQTKRKIQLELRKQMGILVDIPTTGSGNTNTGNTARMFFEQPTLASIVTGVKLELIKRFGIILRTMTCGYAVNVEAFRIYAWETAKIFVSEYPWFYMPQSVHKILIHGADIIEKVSLPIGMMSEEALEARNKDFRSYRLNHTRKDSRLHTMEDLLHALLVSSDPFITSKSKSTSKYSKKHIQIDDEVKQLLLNMNDIPGSLNSDSSDSE